MCVCVCMQRKAAGLGAAKKPTLDVTIAHKEKAVLLSKKGENRFNAKVREVTALLKALLYRSSRNVVASLSDDSGDNDNDDSSGSDPSVDFVSVLVGRLQKHYLSLIVEALNCTTLQALKAEESSNRSNSANSASSTARAKKAQRPHIKEQVFVWV